MLAPGARVNAYLEPDGWCPGTVVECLAVVERHVPPTFRTYYAVRVDALGPSSRPVELPGNCVDPLVPPSDA